MSFPVLIFVFSWCEKSENDFMSEGFELGMSYKKAHTLTTRPPRSKWYKSWNAFHIQLTESTLQAGIDVTKIFWRKSTFPQN